MYYLPRGPTVFAAKMHRISFWIKTDEAPISSLGLLPNQMQIGCYGVPSGVAHFGRRLPERWSVPFETFVASVLLLFC